MVTHSSICAWRIPWTKEPEGLQSMGSQRVGYCRETQHNIVQSYYMVIYYTAFCVLNDILRSLSLECEYKRSGNFFFH